MNRSAWRVLAVLAFALVLLSWFVSVPYWVIRGLWEFARLIRRPFVLCRMHADGWRKVGPHWTLNHPKGNHRKAVRR